ncbi:MAG: type II toxin-antitoxin system HipA family toxin [Alphaproteobacteria bacterium]|nr:type II toxin-antitoxin system HipA family toxin [Alphaproteobacteria bacterium]
MVGLDVYFYGKKIGKLTEKNSRLSFKYNEYADTPLSVNLPLQKEAFNDKLTRSFFNNLLPEEGIREAVAKYKQVSPNNPFALLQEIGGECAGAVELYPEGYVKENESSVLKPITIEKIAELLRNQAQVPLLMGEEIRLSLAGAQQKIALAIIPEDSDNYYLPQGDYISTHIIKPQNHYFKDIIYNEHFCMSLARKIGLSAAVSFVRDFAGEKGYVVKRFDREKDTVLPTGLKRIHQEDFCQVLCLPDKKYQKEGGASIKQCYKFIANNDFSNKADALISFLKAIVFNFIIGNSDAHGKNFSLLHKLGKYELSPLYDLVSTQVYEMLSPDLAMSVGGEYNPNLIHRNHFNNMAKDLGIKPNIIEKIIDEMTSLIINSLPEIKKQFSPEVEIINKIEMLICSRIEQISSCF